MTYLTKLSAAVIIMFSIYEHLSVFINVRLNQNFTSTNEKSTILYFNTM